MLMESQKQLADSVYKQQALALDTYKANSQVDYQNKSLDITSKHYDDTTKYQQDALDETRLHNRATESIQRDSAAATLKSADTRETMYSIQALQTMGTNIKAQQSAIYNDRTYATIDANGAVYLNEEGKKRLSELNQQYDTINGQLSKISGLPNSFANGNPLAASLPKKKDEVVSIDNYGNSVTKQDIQQSVLTPAQQSNKQLFTSKHPEIADRMSLDIQKPTYDAFVKGEIGLLDMYKTGQIKYDLSKPNEIANFYSSLASSKSAKDKSEFESRGIEAYSLIKDNPEAKTTFMKGLKPLGEDGQISVLRKVGEHDAANIVETSKKARDGSLHMSDELKSFITSGNSGWIMKALGIGDTLYDKETFVKSLESDNRIHAQRTGTNLINNAVDLIKNGGHDTALNSSVIGLVNKFNSVEIAHTVGRTMFNDKALQKEVFGSETYFKDIMSAKETKFTSDLMASNVGEQYLGGDYSKTAIPREADFMDRMFKELTPEQTAKIAKYVHNKSIVFSSAKDNGHMELQKENAPYAALFGATYLAKQHGRFEDSGIAKALTNLLK